jgi:putative ABC transport system substrate-binding protein
MVPGPAALALSKAKLTHGVTTQIPLADQFKLIGEALPSARSLGMLYRSNTPDGQKLLKDAQDALPAGWHIEAVAVDQFSSVADAINELTGRRLDLIWTSVDAGVYDGPVVHALLLAALRNNLPVFGFSASFVRAGALLGVGVDPAAQGNQAARIVLQILGHAWDDHNTGVQPPESFQIAVNQIVADKIGVSLPPELLNRSTYVFKDDK